MLQSTDEESWRARRAMLPWPYPECSKSPCRWELENHTSPCCPCGSYLPWAASASPSSSMHEHPACPCSMKLLWASYTYEWPSHLGIVRTFVSQGILPNSWIWADPAPAQPCIKWGKVVRDDITSSSMQLPQLWQQWMMAVCCGACWLQAR